MKNRVLFAAAIALVSVFAAATALAEPPAKPAKKPVLHLSIETGHPNAKVTRSGRLRPWARSGRMKKTIETECSYEGRIVCHPPKGETCTVVVEAFFVKRGSGKNGVSADKIMSRKTIGTYTFTDSGKTSYNFSFTSPKVKQVKTKRRSGGRYNGRTRTSTSGEMYLGCFIRAVWNGEIMSVRASPGNSAWERAGKKPNPTLENSNRL